MKWFTIGAWILWAVIAVIAIAAPSEPGGDSTGSVILSVVLTTLLFGSLHLGVYKMGVLGLAAPLWYLWLVGLTLQAFDIGTEEFPTFWDYLHDMAAVTIFVGAVHLVLWLTVKGLAKIFKPQRASAETPAPEAAETPAPEAAAPIAAVPLTDAERGEKLARVEVLKSQIRADDIERRNYRRPGYYAIGFLVFGVMALFGGLFTLIGLGMCALLLFGAVMPDQDKRELKRLMIELERDK